MIEEKIEINKIPAETEYYDVMGGSHRWEVKVHDHGSVALVDSMPRLAPVGQTADFAICQAARVSYGAGTKKVSEDKGLIRYLYRHQHTSPFEMVEFKFHCVMPVFIARQWIRHRTANVNEYSARYSVMPDKFYHPSAEDVRKQSVSNRQGGEEQLEAKTAQEFLDYLDKVEENYKTYNNLLEKGLSRELGRIGLPVSIYTEWYWKIDLHNLFHFLRLRMDSHSQKEIRDYANTIFALIKPIVPVACEAFMDYAFESIKLTRLEIEAIRSGKPINTTNKRETEEWEQKKQLLGLDKTSQA
ncbi:thymidylate synthase [Dictyostelium purpureum]|uniref:Thymidylate synthase n=1 Tax=Dictyostelium purpureum TaxID=5786 RepID=F0ZE99_DICPU|nr:thymidylate synthase [Dictyostelium purpureum]EGC37735.1 thymidylate synthase [Dictyostelium purpureum]|eukprot:XP_003285756.1 thymidylate synthase [Dictyostelium purpureum]